MHKSFFVLVPRFKSVNALFLESLVNQSLSEIIRLVNHFLYLQKLGLRKCQWRQPAHCYSGIQHKLQKFKIWTESDCEINVLKWLLYSHSTLILRELWINNWIDNTSKEILSQVLEQCMRTLQVLRLRISNNITFSK